MVESGVAENNSKFLKCCQGNGKRTHRRQVNDEGFQKMVLRVVPLIEGHFVFVSTLMASSVQGRSVLDTRSARLIGAIPVD